MASVHAMGTVDLVAAAAALGPRIEAVRDDIDRERRLPQPLVDELVAAGLFRTLLPRALGGLEADPLTALRAIEAVARADGAVGWCVMIGASNAIFSEYLPEAGARAIFGDPAVVTGGFLGVGGRAVAVEGGYRASGRWGFNSGSPHCAWLLGGCIVHDGDTPRTRDDGAPVIRHLFFPAADYTLLDTWHTGGLRGTGSHDFAVDDAFVPEEHTLSLADPPTQPGPLYRFPLMALLAPLVAAPALGIARGAIDALVTLASTKAPLGGMTLLRENALVQHQVAQAEAQLGAARAFLVDTLGAAWDDVCAGRELSLAQRARLRLAGTHATTSAAGAVDLMYTAGGASSIYTSNPLERAFRDVHAATQHIFGQQSNYGQIGRTLLGMDAGPGIPL
jgi:alkylation response protein AidB-like acyl-CoA dehydrogenase